MIEPETQTRPVPRRGVWPWSSVGGANTRYGTFACFAWRPGANPVRDYPVPRADLRRTS